MIRQQFSHLPEVVKNLLIINGLFFLATWALQNRGVDLSNLFALHQFQSPDFKPHQLITHMFMHADFTHLLFNMFALWMFGKTLENMWGGKRFLTYYIITGLGASIIYMAYIQFQINSINIDPERYNMIINKGNDLLNNNQNYSDPNLGKFNLLINVPMLGASGAVYGLLLAFGMLFPNSLIYLYFAIPVKAKYFVGGIGVLALISGIGNNPGDNVAHFAHLGGMIFGIILLKYWKKKGDIYF
tara:strand:- start:232 stop:960 length:729 start_codon:yes stop_codon:yes gene_type:complete